MASGWQRILKRGCICPGLSEMPRVLSKEKTNRNPNLWSWVLTAFLTSPTQVLYNSEVGCLSDACQVLDFLYGFPVGLCATSNKETSTVKSHLKRLNFTSASLKKTTPLACVISQFNVEKTTRLFIYLFLPKAAGIGKLCGTKTLYVRGAC